MMDKLLKNYRKAHEQAFMPIFTRDRYDSKMLVEACVLAGLSTIEYTQRRTDIREMIPWIRANFPDLNILVGSTLDSESIIKHARKNYPQLLTLGELKDMGVEGFVSACGYSQQTIGAYSSSHVLAPAAMTLLEAMQMMDWGAHFIKLFGPDLDFAKLVRLEPLFDFCPFMITGGVTLESIPGMMEAGAMMVGSGMNLVVECTPEPRTAESIAEIIKSFVELAKNFRNKRWPKLAQSSDDEDAAWLSKLPHHHPF